jgi:hypothetical protein
VGVSCPVCGAITHYIVRSRSEVELESRLRARFVEARLGHAPVGLEAMDLTEFMHGGPAEIVACAVCGTLRRKEQYAAQYDLDRYDSTLMEHLYPRYRDAFARKRDHFQPLLRPAAEVLEVGSHLGAFLEVAETWGWKPTGLDIGRETSAFARRQGGSVKRVSLDGYSPAGRLDAIFIWNCFEQLENPWDTLRYARNLLSRHGIVVLRVPNAEFYRHPVHRPAQWFRALSYNNLLGFPYLNGYSLDALTRLLEFTGFEVVASFATSLVTPPYPEIGPEVRKEWYRVRTETEHDGAASGPWIEIVGRAVSLPGVFSTRSN